MPDNKNNNNNNNNNDDDGSQLIIHNNELIGKLTDEAKKTVKTYEELYEMLSICTSRKNYISRHEREEIIDALSNYFQIIEERGKLIVLATITYTDAMIKNQSLKQQNDVDNKKIEELKDKISILNKKFESQDKLFGSFIPIMKCIVESKNSILDYIRLDLGKNDITEEKFMTFINWIKDNDYDIRKMFDESGLSISEGTITFNRWELLEVTGQVFHKHHNRHVNTSFKT
ncbi:hypothetical protein RB653_003405 [Dictyostelium firmibasis]|uniref:Uncharacterized protein n=1 Tax=Dictyostelium firmibasis TaxID=79012 RepID=A0AAN7YZ26_9MYCE